jgi:hypothetical protein
MFNFWKRPDFFTAKYRVSRQAHPFAHLRQQPATRECCKNLQALKLSKEASDLWVAVCLGCSAVHYRMRAEPGKLGVVR